ANKKSKNARLAKQRNKQITIDSASHIGRGLASSIEEIDEARRIIFAHMQCEERKKEKMMKVFDKNETLYSEAA
ncbi:hypothetical protein PENTCL1PPCAC_20238, partial [Pristionchus entomophagus]